MTQARTLRNRMWGEPVAYVRKSTGTRVPITARKSGVQMAGNDGTDVVVQVEYFDWVVGSSDLADAGSRFEPSEGDRIVVVEPGGDTVTYMVGLYGAEECWEPADSENVEKVVHTKVWSEA